MILESLLLHAEDIIALNFHTDICSYVCTNNKWYQKIVLFESRCTAENRIFVKLSFICIWIFAIICTRTSIIMKMNSFCKNSSCRGHSLIMYFSCWLRNMKSTNKTLLVEKPKHVMPKQVLTPRIPISRRISFWPYHVIWVCVWNMCSNVINNGDINDSRAIMLKNEAI